MDPRPENIRNAYLLGEGIYLRGATPDDAQVCAAWFNDEEVNRYLITGRRPNTVENSRKFLRRAMISDRDLVFAIIERKSGRHIGNTGLHRIDYIFRSAAFGLVIGVRECWRRGYGTEATGLVTDYAFSRLNLHRVELEVAAENPGARRVYERVGYKVEGTRREAFYVNGRYIDSVLMSILRPEWEATKQNAEKRAPDALPRA
jgi:RimJ/RimL family protein N-acetyltransferase